MDQLKFEEGLIFRRSFDDKVINNSAITIMLAEKKRQQALKKRRAQPSRVKHFLQILLFLTR